MAQERKRGNPQISQYHFSKGKGLGKSARKYTFRLKDSEADKLETFAKEQGLSIAEAIRVLLRASLNKLVDHEQF